MKRHYTGLSERLPDLQRWCDVTAASRDHAVYMAERDNPGYTARNSYMVEGVWRVELWKDELA